MSIVTLNDRGVRSVTTFGSVNTGSMVFIKKLTASSDSTLSFIDGASDVVLDSTYKEYLFIFNNLHPGTDAVQLTFQANASGGSGFDETLTTTYWRARHKEDGTDGVIGYEPDYDLAQSTNFQVLSYGTGNDNDQGCSGTLHLFNPSSTTFVKHFISRVTNCGRNDHARSENAAGYFNTTSAIDEIQFKFHSGNIDSGTITLYGIN